MKICEAGRSSGCCRNPDIRTINTMDADTAGNFEIRAGAGVGITTETNGIRIAYTGGITVYTNTDGNLDIDNANFTIDLANDIVIAGNLTVNGTYYTVHAEHVYTEDDYIIMRDGAVTGLGSGDFSGFQVKLYDGVNDGRLVIDNSGTARVGDVGDEQPLLTRDESADLTDGNLLEWDGTNQKAVDAGVAVSGLQTALTITSGTIAAGPDRVSGSVKYWKYGRVCTLIFTDIVVSATGYNKIIGTVPSDLLPYTNTAGAITKSDATNTSLVTVLSSDGKISCNMNQTDTYYGTLTYITAQ